MEVILEGRVAEVLVTESGVSKAGNAWHKQSYILEQMDEYKKKVKITFFGDKADAYPLQVDDVVKVFADIESREFNGRWFTDVNAYRAENANGAAPSAPIQPAFREQPKEDPVLSFHTPQPDDDTPF